MGSDSLSERVIGAVFAVLEIDLAARVRELRERRGLTHRAGGPAGIESVARRQDGSGRPLGIA